MVNYLFRAVVAIAMLCSPFYGLAQNASPESNIRSQLIDNHDIAPEALNDLVLADRYTTEHNQVTHYYYLQTYAGIEIYNAQLAVHVKNGKVVHVNNGLVSTITVSDISFQLSAKAAVMQAAEYLELELSETDVIELFHLYGRVSENPVFSAPDIAAKPIEVKKYLLPYGKKLVPVWNVSIYLKDYSHYWNLRLDATSGKVLDKNDYVVECNWDPEDGCAGENHYHAQPSVAAVRSSAAAQGSNEYLVFPFPVESPNHGNRELVADAHDSLASPFGWHDTDGVTGHEHTDTRGNNVLAWDDLNNSGGGSTVDGGSSLSFVTDFDKSQSASNYTDAAIVNLFFWNNIMHDVWYNYGFDEASGNFQANNYNGEGISGDFVIADAQDGGGFNNANFSSPPDGDNGRMQMYLWGNVNPGAKLLAVAPNGIKGYYTAIQADFGPDLTSVPITEDLVLVSDGSSNPTEGCNTLTNGTDLSGKIALIDRGTCSFVQKVKNAQNAGAVAVIIINNINGAPFSMSGSDASITIPSLMISRADGDIFKNELSKSVTVTVSLYDSASESFFYDSDFDNGVIAHEYGHGISTRLTGGPSNSGCLQNEEQMGEGWSDFFALVMTHQPGDSGAMKRGIGTYVKGQAIRGNGIRPYPYSTDTNINPTTYADVSNGQFSVPHGVGSIWCQMLWDLYWAFIDEYGYDPDVYRGTGGNNMVMQLVIDGLKLQPCGPGFTDGRDAILLADRINNGGSNQKLIWDVFAARGLGYSANQGSSASRLDGTAAFDVPTHLFSLSVEKHAAQVFKGGDEAFYRFVVRNFGDSTARGIVIRDTLDELLIPKLSGVNCDWTFTGNVASFTIDELLPFDTFSCQLRVVIKNDRYSVIGFEDDIENGDGIWSAAVNQGSGGFVRTGNKSHSGNASWFIDNPDSESDRYLAGTLNVGEGNPALAFYHHFETEGGWDGAVVEIDTGDGWIDLGPNFFINGYNSDIQENPASAISGQPAFTGNSNGFILSAIDLSAYGNREINIRFRFVSDGAMGGNGWYIDDITLFDTFEFVKNRVTVEPDNYPVTSAEVLSVMLEGKDPVGVQEVQSVDGIQVYPNPAAHFISIQNRGLNDATILLTDVNGRVLLRSYVPAGEQTDLDVAALARGVYFVNAVSDVSNVTIRVVLK